MKFLYRLFAVFTFIGFVSVGATAQGGDLTQIKIKNCTDINTEHLEYSPSFYQNGLIFITAPTSSGPKDMKIGETFFEMYFSEFDGDGMPTDPEDFSFQMNTRVHEGPATFNRTYNEMYFSRNNLKKNATKADESGKVRMQIFQSKKTFFDWEIPTKLPFSDKEYDVMHPTLSPGGNTLYFTSNMPGSIGGTDIWMVKKIGDDWGTPVNMGPEINTDKNDAFPFIHESGTLFFASLGHKGMGGYDIFRVNVDGSKTLPERGGSKDLVLKLVRKNADSLGAPDLLTNGEGESEYSMQSGRSYIFFVTKDGYTSNELTYSTVGKEGEIIVEVPLSKERCADVTGQVKNAVTGAGISNAVVRMSSSCGGKEEFIQTDANGNFSACLPTNCSYTFIGEKSGFNSGTSALTVNPGDKGLSTIISLSPVAPAVATNPFPVGTVIVFDKIYYDFNKSAIRTGAARELDEAVRIMQTYPSINIELSSHTDTRGGNAYNQKLSNARAESAKRFMVARGVAPSRIRTVGMGENQLRNRCADGVNCTEEEHQYNRRTEFKVVSIQENVRVEYGDRGPETIDRMKSRRRN